MPDAVHGPDSARKRPLRILIGADTFPPDVNGAANFSSRLAAGLVARGHNVRVEAPAASLKHGAIVERHDGESFTVHRLFSLRWYPHDWLRFAMPWTSQANAKKILHEFKPDVVHIQSHIIVGRGLARQAHKHGIRVVATNHFMPENLIEHTLLPRFLRKTAIDIAWNDASKTYRLCDAVTSPSRKAADFLEAETGLTGVHAVSCGITASDYTPSFAPKTENRVVFVGRVTGEKHLDVLLRAAAKLDPALRVKLEIVGGGDLLHQLRQLANELGIGSSTIFTGHVSDEELRAALTRATVFAIPSIAELQSIATMEAMASGLPIVAANAMALPHLVHNGKNGYLFEPANVDDLAAKLTEVLTASDAELARMKRNSLKYIEAHDIERTLDTFESLYRGEPVTDPVTDVSVKDAAK
ncbi:MAG: glycosyltransferase [Terrimesophilobacter sp.]